MSKPPSPLRSPGLAGAVLTAVALAFCLCPAPAQAWWRGGVYFGIAPPVVYPPPPYYGPPPPYYGPPPGYYPPPGAYGAPPGAVASRQSCYVGPAPMCPMDHPTAPGNTCWCSTGAGRAYGKVY